MTAAKLTEKVLKKSVDVLIDKADDAKSLARAQRRTADEQHHTAQKLEALSEELAKGAAELKETIAAGDK
jgi:hypothetical protein